MVMATFRFFGELNDFLARERRHAAFATPCARAATAKHLIEALGVPHTEVGRLLVNGAPGRLERLLEEGDDLAVYVAATCTRSGRKNSCANCSSACPHPCANSRQNSPPATVALACTGKARTISGCWRCSVARLG